MQAQIPQMNASRMTVLNSTVAKLNKDASNLYASRTPSSLRLNVAKLQTDLEKVHEVIAEVVNEAKALEAAAVGEPLNIKKPVEHIKKFLNKNPQLARKTAIEMLVSQGINMSTARTQYHRWKQARSAN